MIWTGVSRRGGVGQQGDVVVGHADAAVAGRGAQEGGVVGAVEGDLAHSAAEAVVHLGEGGHAHLVRPVRP